MFDIITFILGVLAGAGGIVLAVKGSITLKGWGTEYDERDRRINVDRTYNVRIPALVATAAGGLLILISTYYGQDPGEAIVVKSFAGSVQNVDTTQGASFTAPWNSRISFDVRNQKIEMFTNRDKDGNVESEGDDGAEIQAPTKEGTNVGVSITIRFSVRPDCVRDLYTEFKSNDNFKDRALKPDLRDVVRVETAKYSVFAIKQRRADVSTGIFEALTEQWEDDLCIAIDDVNLGNLQLDRDTEAKLVEINAHQADVESARSDLQAAEVRAETVKVNAQATADADQITRCGATTRTEVQDVAGEETEVEVVVPVPIDRCQNRLNEQVLVNNYIEALQKMAEDGNLVVVDSNINSILNLPAAAGGG